MAMGEYLMIPLISVIIPVYNVSQYLSQCIQSVLAQTYRNFEIILVDDGSTDDSSKICDTYAERDSRIRIKHQNNGGVSSARNEGLQLAQGKYITFVDADDWVENDYLAELLKNMPEFGMTVCEFTTNKDEMISSGSADILNREEAYISLCSSHGIGGFCWGKLFNNELIKRTGIKFDLEVTVCEDLIFVSHYLNKCSPMIEYIHKKIYHYRINLKGATLGRYHQSKTKCKRKYVTEFDGCLKAAEYAVNDLAVQKAFQMRTTKGACNTLRAIVTMHDIDKEIYRRCLIYVRSHCMIFIRSPINVNSSKISVLLCTISPRIEFFVFNICMKIKKYKL